MRLAANLRLFRKFPCRICQKISKQRRMTVVTISALMPTLAALDGGLLPRINWGDNAEPRGWPYVPSFNRQADKLRGMKSISAAIIDTLDCRRYTPCAVA